MVYENIEKLKREYTDKYVVVDDQRPELRRFKDMTGIVKTVNMSGRALVEFDHYENIGWYDIELDFLRVVDKPVEKQVEKKATPSAPAKKTAVAKKETQPAGKGAGSVEDILAAARADAKPAAKKVDADTMNVQDVLAAARGEKATQADAKAATKPKTDSAKMSVADVLAAARGGDAAGVESSTDVAHETVAEESAASSTDEAPSTEASQTVATDELPTDIEGILAYCRQKDG